MTDAPEFDHAYHRVVRLSPAEQTTRALMPVLNTNRKAFKRFQREDLPRLALHDGGILAWDTGLGKTWAMFLWPLLKVGFDRENGFVPNEPVLIVAPEHLHEQIEGEARNQFKAHLTRLESQDNYMDMILKNGGKLKPGWYIVSFTQLASNKVVKVPAASTIFKEDKLKFYMELLNINLRKTLAEKKYITNTDGSGSVRPATDIEKMQNSIDETMAKCESNTIGMTVNNIRCIFSPSLAELCRKDFACVVIDEATKIKGQETDVGLGVRLMDPPYRLVLSATPIKNRLPDLFWLAWWATGGKAEAHARWPYSREAGEQDKFAQEFLVSERNLSAEARANDGKPLSNNVRGGRQRRGKVTAEVCNIHRLWKLIGPVILRRRKRDIGEDLVEKIRQPVRVPMGTEQARVYEYHLKAGYIDKHGKPAIGAQLQALRSAAAAPHSALLEAQSEDDFDKPYRSKFEYIPKVAACLTVIENVIRKGEQIVIFSAFHEPLDTLARRLKQAGVPFEQLDGRDSQEHRGKIAALFKLGRPKAKPVLLAGVGAMAEGHSWDLANNCALIAYDWAYNLFEQAINRIHRLNSKKVVNVYPIMCLGSVDRKLEALIEEKGNACELVLDGKLLGENIEEVNLAELLQIAAAEFADQKTYPEELLEKEWPALRARLGHAMEVSSYIGVRNGGIRKVPVETAFRMPTFDMSNIPVIRMTREEVRDVVANLSRALHAPMRKISASFW